MLVCVCVACVRSCVCVCVVVCEIVLVISSVKLELSRISENEREKPGTVGCLYVCVSFSARPA